ncbi:hypothetical protein [Oceanobacillus salinisoli]|uniref:hypothetical protein n=1 Tax=Oceanobacillus salinisoli TaxID=2678611 RepID=UPI0012E2697F|nr:hypothetical protein [Oceanobacillus salinisoli]
MLAILPSQKRGTIKRIENKLYTLVDTKEKREQVIDSYGRSLVMTLREYLDNAGTIKYKNIMREVKKYIKRNEHYI